MKRLVIILTIFAVMMGFAIFELVFTTTFYEKQYNLLIESRASFDIDPKALDRDENIEVFSRALDHFNNGKNMLMVLSNHNAIKYIDEKLVSISELIRMNQEYDAYVALSSVTNFVRELGKDNVPHIGNLL